MRGVVLAVLAMAVLAAAFTTEPPKESTWEALPGTGGQSMLAVMDHTAVAGNKDYMYVFGGFLTDGTPTDTVQTFHFETFEADQPTFSGIGPMPRGGHCMVSLSDDEAIVFGGANSTTTATDGSKVYYNDLWRMNMKLGTWTEIKLPAGTDLPTERAHMGCALLGNTMFVWGGETIDADTSEALELNDMWAINIIAGSAWQTDVQGDTDIPDRRWGHALVPLGQGEKDYRLALWGGMYTDEITFDQRIRADGMWFFTPSAQKWERQAPTDPGFQQAEGLASRAFTATMHIADGVVDTIIASGGYGEAMYSNQTVQPYYDSGLPDMSVNVVWGSTASTSRLSTGYYETHIRGAPALQKHVMVMDPSQERHAYTFLFGGQQPNAQGPSNAVWRIQWFRDELDKCSLYDRCETCTASLDCGFCGAASEGALAFCAGGDSDGFTNPKDKCNTPGAYSYSECPSCAELSCSGCASHAQCGWCADRGDHAVGTCVPGVEEGPIDFHECADEWLYAAAECPYTTGKVKGGVVAGVILSTLASAAIVAAFFRYRHKL